MIIGLLVLFRRRCNRPSASARALSAGSYAVYIIHAPVLVFLSLALRPLSLHSLIKFAVLGLVAVPLCFSMGLAIRRLPPARRIL